jgi:hypothetical protein
MASYPSEEGKEAATLAGTNLQQQVWKTYRS